LFHKWAEDLGNNKPYGSWGNGGAMRISPCGYLNEGWDSISKIVKRITSVTHNTEEAITGALAITECIYRAKETQSKEIIKFYASKYYPELKEILKNFDDIKLEFECSTNGTVPYAIAAFLKSDDFESCLRNAVLLGGDTDTIAAMSCAIAEPFYKEIPIPIMSKALSLLPDEFLLALNNFYSKYYNANCLYIENLKVFAYSAIKRVTRYLDAVG
jgi:ADP-ribosylglycohydrolase